MCSIGLATTIRMSPFPSPVLFQVFLNWLQIAEHSRDGGYKAFEKQGKRKRQQESRFVALISLIELKYYLRELEKRTFKDPSGL